MLIYPNPGEEESGKAIIVPPLPTSLGASCAGGLAETEFDEDESERVQSL